MAQENIFGRLLRSLREGSGKSMGQLARHLEVSVTFISDVERGTRAPFTHSRILQAAAFLDVDAGQLLEAAAEYRGAIELALTERTSPKARKVGAALMRGWEGLTEEQLKRIEDVLRKKGDK
jgi:transcriptional regulator with XRE-family HTH domain